MRARAIMLLMAVLVLMPLPVLAGMGVSPGSVDFRGMLRGGYYERYVTVSNPEEDDAVVNIGVEGPVATWFITEPSKFTLPGKAFMLVKIIVRPPNDTPNGLHTGSILFASRPAAQEEFGGSGAQALSAVSVSAVVEVTDVEVLQLKDTVFGVPNTEECRPILVTASYRNTGNIRVVPRVHVDLYTAERKLLESADQTGDTVLPTQAGVTNMRLPFKTAEFICLPIGRYVADVTVTGNGQQMGQSSVPFEIFSRGTLTVSGQLVEVTVPGNITLGETIKIEGVFKNTGQIPELSKLVAEVSQGGNVVGNVAGDELEVLSGGMEKLSAFYKPGSPGRYKLSSYVTYEGHVTERQNKEVDVLWPLSYLVGGAVIVVGVVVALIVLARRRGRSQANQRKR